MTPREVFESELPMVRQVISFVCRRHRLFHEEAEDFRSFALVKLVDNDYAILRKFEGRSSLRTYLTIVVERLSIDYQISRRGKWRPSARAVELGPEAIELDTLLHRNGYSAHEAVQTVLVSKRSGLSEESLLEVVRQLPSRPRRAFDRGLATPLPAGESAAADRLVVDQEREAELRRVRSALSAVLAKLSPEDRLVARLRFLEGWPPNRIATAVSRDPKNLYRRIERIKRELRKLLQNEGIHGPVDLAPP
jgi:RNA polymerase sigma factor for flagellar operon FliA